MSLPVEQIKERLNIVDIVSQYIKLEKAGSNFRARCPFHTEKTPSFFVSPARNTYHCFGCNNGGDIFSFIEGMEGLDFKGALKILAEKAGVDILPISKEQKDEKERLYGILEETTLFFQIQLTKNKEALSYLYKRGLKSETLKKFRIGFASDGWSALYDFLKAKSYTDMEMEKAGLIVVKTESGRPYDRFRRRIMFPISDNAGRVVAFSGRIFGEEDNMGKYINSPETELFHKSDVLYGYEKAKHSIRKEDLCLVVEGQMDLLLSHQAGVENTVAISGTALTSSHIRMIKRLTSNIVFAFDADQAGIKALYKSAIVSLPQDVSVEVVDVPEGSDPADIISANPDIWRDLISSRKNVISYLLSFLKDKESDVGRFRKKAGEVILPLIKRIGNKITQEHFMEEAANEMSVSKEAVKEEINKVNIDDYGKETEHKEQAGKQKNFHNRKDILENQIISVLLWQKSLKSPEVSIDNTQKQIASFSNDFSDTFNSLRKENMQQRIFEAEQYFEGKQIAVELEELVSDFKKEIIKEELKKETLRLREAEKSGDAKKIGEVMKRYQELSDRINN